MELLYYEKMPFFSFYISTRVPIGLFFKIDLYAFMIMQKM